MKKGLNETCYKFFSTLANPTRLAIMEHLMNSPMSVSEITGALNQEQSMVSHNLRKLARCGFVSSDSKGNMRVYHGNHETFEALLQVIDNHAKKYCPTGGKCKQ
ncbi:MAG: ArsR/SmtB family transcription factor [Candidatus Bathyarchaeia archaeon]